jgi:FAD/FMN-containing dehydrogenase
MRLDRRSLLAGATSLGLVCGSIPAIARGGAHRIRRNRPGDPGWPHAADWQALAAATGGNVSTGSPLLAACAGGLAKEACRDVLANISNPFFVGDQPGGTQVSGWIDAWTPAPSAYVLKARHAQDVAAAIDFARHHGIRLVVKGGGHSYQGTSNAPDSLLIWTRSMREVVLRDAFVGEGCTGTFAPVPAVTVGAGALWIDVYDAVTTKAGRYVQGGGCTTVGVAGLIQSGGFGSFSKRFGTAASGLLEAQVVTADGKVRVANACTNPDLFWALKGGGGGNWGVVTSLTLRTYELPDYFGAAEATIKAVSDTAYRALIERFMSFYAEHLFNPHWGEQAVFAPDNTLKISMVCQGLDRQTTAALWTPFFDWIRASSKSYSFMDEPYAASGPARHWWDAEYRKARGSTSMVADARPGAPAHHAWWSGDQEQVGLFLHGYESIWLPAELLGVGRRGALADSLFAASRIKSVELHFNKGLAGAPRDVIALARQTATNPAVTGAFALAIVADGEGPAYTGWPGVGADQAAARADARKIDRAAAALRAIVPRAGSYVSESNYFNPRWQDAFWGSNHARLRAVKDKYDPEGLFFMYHGVGSERWTADGFARAT